jgi:hypothetical protein
VFGPVAKVSYGCLTCLSCRVVDLVGWGDGLAHTCRENLQDTNRDSSDGRRRRLEELLICRLEERNVDHDYLFSFSIIKALLEP